MTRMLIHREGCISWRHAYSMLTMKCQLLVNASVLLGVFVLTSLLTLIVVFVWQVLALLWENKPLWSGSWSSWWHCWCWWNYTSPQDSQCCQHCQLLIQLPSAQYDWSVPSGPVCLRYKTWTVALLGFQALALCSTWFWVLKTQNSWFWFQFCMHVVAVQC